MKIEGLGMISMGEISHREHGLDLIGNKIGRASCRERVCLYV